MLPSRHFSPATALSVIVANMVGTGVFTSLGFQLVDLRTGFPLIMLWVFGGLAALCGAMCYGELGAALPRSGGEYNFLARSYHGAVGFVGGWVSAIIGFSAPVALAAMTFGAYLQAAFGGEGPEWVRTALAAGLVIVMTLVHAGRRTSGGNIQIVFTLLKVLVIVVFCIAALWFAPELQPMGFMPIEGDGKALTSGAFAISLIYVSYAYTGWNAATYVSGELAEPQRDLPRILIAGTIAVMLLYVALNAVFLLVAPMETMVGRLEVGVVAAEAAFGPSGAKLATIALALLLISTVSAMTIAGPRVLQVIGEDLPILGFLAVTNTDGVPSRAIFLQAGIALLFILTSSFDAVLVFSGFTLAAMSFATVVGLIILRWKEPDLDRPYRVSLFPIPPMIYLGLTGWTLTFVLVERPLEGLAGLGLMFVGLVAYLGLQRADDRK